MKKSNIFKKRSRINAPIEDVFEWHARPGAIERLSPPWDPLFVLDRKGGIEKGATVTLKMKAGPFYYKWYAEHTIYEQNRLFQDREVKGPFSQWIHTHHFEPAGDTSCFLEDTIDYRLPFYPFGDILVNAHVQNKLARIFDYRHRTTESDIKLHRLYKNKPRKTILISGAGGLIGSSLIPFLTTGGHRVIRLVRKKSHAGPDAVFWNPVSGILLPDTIEGIDAVIHLAGENIGEGRWTAAKKKKILESRVKGTRLIADVASRLSKKPDAFICASAIGYYGDRGDCLLNEGADPGTDFLSTVCSEWENATAPAANTGIRTASMRIGVVLTPCGGALKKLLFPFKAGFGATIGTGRQYMSWIGMDDAIGAIYHTLMNDHITGPVNVVSPNPVTNAEFSKTLGRVLSRPVFFSLSEAVIKTFFGKMGEEILLASTRVEPQRLLETGYEFRYPSLQDMLAHILGKQ